jgi:hypothetical protein
MPRERIKKQDPNRKEEVKLSLFAVDVILYMKDSNKFTKNTPRSEKTLLVM